MILPFHLASIWELFWLRGTFTFRRSCLVFPSYIIQFTSYIIEHTSNIINLASYIVQRAFYIQGETFPPKGLQTNGPWHGGCNAIEYPIMWRLLYGIILATRPNHEGGNLPAQAFADEWRPQRERVPKRVEATLLHYSHYAPNLHILCFLFITFCIVY